MVEANRARAPDVGPDGRYVQPPYPFGLSDEQLAAYLRAHGLEWVVVLRRLVWEFDPLQLRRAPYPVGRKPFHPLSLLGLLLYGVLKRVRSPRALQKLAASDLCAWYICHGLQPSAAKLEHFLKQTRPAMESPFFVSATQRLLCALESALGRRLEPGVGSLDGTVIEAATSRHRTLALREALALRERLQAGLREQSSPSAEALFFPGAKPGRRPARARHSD
jgi:hypothetical protein